MSKKSRINPKDVSSDNPLPIVSCHQVYYAIKEEEGYGTPIYLPNLTEIAVEKNYNSTPFYAEGVLKHTHTVLGEIPITIATGDLEEEHEVVLMGHRVDSNGFVIRSTHDQAPDVAIMFTVEKRGGIYKGYVFYDGKFMPSGVSAATAEGSANDQPKTITGNFKPLDDGTVDASKTLKSLKEVEEFFKAVPIPNFAEEDELTLQTKID
ncbi:hypothetical protein GMB70_13785 [Turicibacter sanguinis]|nr:hypothetical protein [Turicibacter sanguinis]